MTFSCNPARLRVQAELSDSPLQKKEGLDVHPDQTHVENGLFAGRCGIYKRAAQNHLVIFSISWHSFLVGHVSGLLLLASSLWALAQRLIVRGGIETPAYP